MIIEGFGGPGGWSEGLALRGRSAIGIELDADACATATAAGHTRVRADVARFPLDLIVGNVEGLIMSPPCPTFSTAGRGAGVAVIGELMDAIRDAAHGGDLEPHRALIADMMRAEMGDDADGVASEAMLTCEPAPTIDAKAVGAWTLHTNRDQRPDGSRQTRECTAPAPALTAKSGGQWTVNDAIRITIEDALVLQSFRRDYPLVGNRTSRFKQVGNAVPPLLAAAVLGQML